MRFARRALEAFSVALFLGELGVGFFLCSAHRDAGPQLYISPR
jgi:hypothetical protein